jgi:hypothetical protein
MQYEDSQPFSYEKIPNHSALHSRKQPNIRSVLVNLAFSLYAVNAYLALLKNKDSI